MSGGLMSLTARRLALLTGMGPEIALGWEWRIERAVELHGRGSQVAATSSL